MNIEIKVGQVWRHVHTKKDWKVIFVGRYAATLSDAEGTFTDSLWKFDEGIYSLVSDSPLSDLEIVQKAVECSGGYLWLDSEGCWQIEGNANIIGGGISSLLTWAKQTIGEK